MIYTFLNHCYAASEKRKASKNLLAAYRLSPQQKGFTLVELIIVMGLFAVMTSLLLQNIFYIYRFREVVRYKKEINSEAAIVLNNGIAGMIRSGFGINYAKTDASVSQYLNDPAKPDGVRLNTDKVSVFMDSPGVKNDKGGRRYFTISRSAYVNSGDLSDTARLMITFYNGDQVIESYPLNSSNLVIEDFDVEVPPKPTTDIERDLHPYITIYVRARRRYPLGDLSRVDDLEPYETVATSYQTTFMLRNKSG